jgi:hypothetical protein
MAKSVLIHASKVLAKAKDAIALEHRRAPPEAKAIRRTRQSELKGLVWHRDKLERRLITVEVDHTLRRALEALDRKDPDALSDRLREAAALLESPRSAPMLKRKRDNFSWRIRRLEGRLKRAHLNAQWTKEWHDARKTKPEVPSEFGITRRCKLPNTLGLFVSPERPSAERPFRVIAVSAQQRGGLELAAFGPLDALERLPTSPPRLAVSPFVGPSAGVDAWVGSHTPSQPGLWRVVAYREGLEVGCINVPVDAARARTRRRGYRLKRPKTRSWGPQEELLYTAWVHHLFDEAEGKTWPSLDVVTRNPERNFLHNHLELGEDNVDLATQRRDRLKRLASAEDTVRVPEVRQPPGLVLRPDCADLVVFLRAYFAWKLGLPFAKFMCPLGRELRANCEPGIYGNTLRFDVSSLGEEERTDLYRRAREALALLPSKPNKKSHVRALWGQIIKTLGAHESSKMTTYFPADVVNHASGGSVEAVPDSTELWRSVAAREHGYSAVGQVLGPYCDKQLCTFYQVAGYVGLHEGPLWRREVPSVSTLQAFFDSLAAQTWSDQLRASLATEKLLVYPIALTAESLTPGVMFADPHSHLMTVVSMGQRPGAFGQHLLAVDGQPDGTIAIKRFWRGTFVFDEGNHRVGAGFKAFRPLKRGEFGARALTNAELEERITRPFSMAQQGMRPDDFYTTIDTLLNDDVRDPEVAYLEAHEALLLLLKYRVIAIAAGESAQEERSARTIAMPKGRKIFQSAGAWESFSTPCRDLRLLLAMDAIRDFPERVVRQSARFMRPEGASVGELTSHLQMLHGFWARHLSFDYLKSDGSSHTLTLSDVFERIETFEHGYNPNDCPEYRWGALEGSEELSSCSRRAPKRQHTEMLAHQHWFQARYACR